MIRNFFTTGSYTYTQKHELPSLKKMDRAYEEKFHTNIYVNGLYIHEKY